MKFHPSIFHTRFDSPLGAIIVAASPTGLAGVWFDGQRYLPAQAMSSSPAWPADDGHPVLRQTCVQLGQYFAGQRSRFDIALDLTGGTPFQQAVWQALQAIVPGATASYGDISRMVGRPAAVRAVGAAIGRNPVSIIVPCHRVLGADGALTGYAGGIERKVALLRLEAAPVTAAGQTPMRSRDDQVAACDLPGA
jgi:methylated-DNA-[protein]-cysteine S-methyltransferase